MLNPWKRYLYNVRIIHCKIKYLEWYWNNSDMEGKESMRHTQQRFNAIWFEMRWYVSSNSNGLQKSSPVNQLQYSIQIKTYHWPNYKVIAHALNHFAVSNRVLETREQTEEQERIWIILMYLYIAIYLSMFYA